MREHLVIDMFLGGAVVRCTEGSFRFHLVAHSTQAAWVIKLTDVSKTRVPRLVAVERGRTLSTIRTF